MPHSSSYYTLVASLPALPRHFDVEHVPISLLDLKQRLEMLTSEDAEVVKQLLELFRWSRQPNELTDENAASHYNNLIVCMNNRLARHIVTYQRDIQAVVSSLRRRRRGLPPAPGLGQWTDHIRNNWEHPELRLHWQYPWIAEVARTVGTTDCVRIERSLLEFAWDHWYRVAEHYFFSFEAVLLYLTRWEIIHRWVSRDATRGRQYFDQLVMESLSEYVNLYE